MKTIDILTSIEGRSLLSKIYHEFRFKKQLSNFSTLSLCWKICTQERELFRYIEDEVTITHPLGLFSGTALWLEEIINRFYFSTINSFVYFGAAILLVLVGIRRFSDSVDDNIVIIGVVFEALMLFFMFFVMLFTPQEIDQKYNGETQEQETLSDLLIDIGEISRDFAASVVQMERIEEHLNELINQQGEMIKSIDNIAQASIQSIAPNPKLIQVMSETNTSLEEFKNTVSKLNQSAELLKQQEIEIAVRREVEKLLINKISGNMDESNQKK